MDSVELLHKKACAQYQKAFAQVAAFAIFKTKNHVANITLKTTAKGVTAYVHWLGSSTGTMPPMCRGSSKIGDYGDRRVAILEAETKSIEHETTIFICADKLDLQKVSFFRGLSNYKNRTFDKIEHWHERLEPAGFTWIRAL
jgi:hypothetical protein